MPVHLRPVNMKNLDQCLNLKITKEQENFVTGVAKSLAQAYVAPGLYPLAIYDEKALGCDEETQEVVGFAMYEIHQGVGFILRLLIDEKHQNKGYGKSTILELIRRLKLHQEVEIIAISHRKVNEKMSNICKSLGFVHWEIEDDPSGREQYLRLPERT